MRRQVTEWEKILAKTYLIKDYYPTYKKNFFFSKTKTGRSCLWGWYLWE
jgi:hypothetical protein